MTLHKKKSERILTYSDDLTISTAVMMLKTNNKQAYKKYQNNNEYEYGKCRSLRK